MSQAGESSPPKQETCPTDIHRSMPPECSRRSVKCRPSNFRIEQIEQPRLALMPYGLDCYRQTGMTPGVPATEEDLPPMEGRPRWRRSQCTLRRNLRAHPPQGALRWNLRVSAEPVSSCTGKQYSAGQNDY
eukprot:5625897-Amphidinium_carterae.2